MPTALLNPLRYPRAPLVTPLPPDRLSRPARARIGPREAAPWRVGRPPRTACRAGRLDEVWGRSDPQGYVARSCAALLHRALDRLAVRGPADPPP